MPFTVAAIALGFALTPALFFVRLRDLHARQMLTEPWVIRTWGFLYRSVLTCAHARTPEASLTGPPCCSCAKTAGGTGW